MLNPQVLDPIPLWALYLNANAIRTAYPRAGYLEEPQRSEIRELLRLCADLRLAVLDPTSTVRTRACSQWASNP